MNSCLYEGWVRHRRQFPVSHQFRYRLFLVYLDLAELPGWLDQFAFWSATRPALAWFRRQDYLDQSDRPLDEVVREQVEAAGYPRPQGPIRLLTHLRYFGYIMNPVSFYFCFDQHERTQNVIADVTNTPWREKHAYVLDPAVYSMESAGRHHGKRFHVSPFMHMDMQYRWRLSEPGPSLTVHIENHDERESRPIFDVTMRLQRVEVTRGALTRVMLRYPLMTFQVIGAIYWQALRLKWKGAPFFPHPSTSRGGRATGPGHVAGDSIDATIDNN